MSALSIATEGWLHGPLSIATSGYLTISLPENVPTESILSVFFESDLPDLVLVEVGGSLRVSVEGDYLTSIEMREDLLYKTIKFFDEYTCLELESFTDTTIKFINKEVNVEMEVGLTDPLESTDIDHT